MALKLGLRGGENSNLYVEVCSPLHLFDLFILHSFLVRSKNSVSFLFFLITHIAKANIEDF